VYSFEPAPHAAAEMKRHLAANGLKNVTIVPFPVSNAVREVRFCLTDGAYGSAINDTETRWPVLQLQSTTLDLFIKDHPEPDFLKMDVEGEEVACWRARSKCSREAGRASAPRCTIARPRRASWVH